MAIVKEKYLNVAVKHFDDADKFMDMEPASEVAKAAVAMLEDIKHAAIEFASENQGDIRSLYKAVTSENGKLRKYGMQSTDFAKQSFDDYIGKVLSIPDAVKKGTISDDLSLNAGFFDRDRQFMVALFSKDENECVPIPAEDAFEELKYLQILTQMVDEYSKQLMDKAAMVPGKKEVMDGVAAKNYDTSLMAVRLMASSMVRFCSLILRHMVNNSVYLFDYAMADHERWLKNQNPSIYWRGDEEAPKPTEAERWAIFV